LLSLFDDWADFTGEEHRRLLERVARAAGAVKDDWSARSRETPAAVADFYDESSTTTPLLVWWHANDINPARCAVGSASVMRAIAARTVLDFGCGIGSTALVLGRGDLRVTLAEVSGEMLDFARWRLGQREIPHDALDLRTASLGDLAPGSLDAVVAFDVFEHIPDVAPHLQLLDRALAENGVICLNQAYVSKWDTNVAHFQQHGEVLQWLHGHGYRLAHVPSICWVAQKAPLAAAAHRAQAASLRARVAAVRTLDSLDARIRGRVEARVARLAMR
jgi:cyclopropane fatty-acyl-phospholipid synthase-like methyltransferase